jgi:pimeloyl-ACP methyl ester carboxylesterase
MRALAARSGRGGQKLATAIAVGGVVLAATALLNSALARRAERRYPPQGKFVTIDGVRLHYLERGTGSPVVFLHGNGAMAEDFAISSVLDRIARHHRVIAFDRPGFGFSARPRQTIWTAAEQGALLRKALRRIGVEKPVLVGHSWGTLVALAMALDEPDGTPAIVLLSGYYFPAPRAEVALGFWPAIPVLGDVLRYTVAPLLGRLVMSPILHKIFAPDAVTAAFAARFPSALTLRPSQIRASAADTALMIPSAAALLHRHDELTMPIMIMAGSDDAIVATDRHSRRLHAQIAHSQFRPIAGAGHMIHHIAPDQVADTIRAAVAAADSGRESSKGSR